MFKVTSDIWVCGCIDMRKGLDSLICIINGEDNLDCNNGDFFIFINKRGNKIKILFYKDKGFNLYYKKLSYGKFNINLDDKITKISRIKLNNILSKKA